MLADKTKTLAGGGVLGKFHNMVKKDKTKVKPKTNTDLDEPRIERWDDVEYSPSDSFRQASRLFLTLGRFLCCIPLNHDEFRWFSFWVILSTTAIACNILMTILSMIWIQKSGFNIFKGGIVLFFGASSIAMILFIRLSMKWPILMKRWEIMERYQGHRKYLSYKFNIVTLFIVVITFLEHVSFLITGLLTVNKDSEEILKNYCILKFPQVFTLIQFRLWHAFPILMLNMFATLTFSFVDQLVIMFSIGLNDFFEELNERIGQERKQKLLPQQWKTFRSDYTRLCNLVLAVDDCICHLLFSTFALHLFTICIELHLSMMLSADREEKVQVVFSFIIAGAQACALCYFTVKVHDKSRSPLNALYAVPSISYCQEVEIFTLQVLKSHVSLTGSHIFSMTRRLLLTVVGTVLSYEILLLQLKLMTAGKVTLAANYE